MNEIDARACNPMEGNEVVTWQSVKAGKYLNCSKLGMDWNKIHQLYYP